MLKRPSPHTQAVLQALLVTFLWSTSWVLIKFGLADIPALPFAGLRYALAWLCLLPFALRSGQLESLRRLPVGMWGLLAMLGLLFYAVTQGAQFLSLVYLPAATGSLLLSFTTILVAFLGITLLGERPTPLQWIGSGLYLVGVLAYFYPLSFLEGEGIGLVVAGVGVLANALSSILGRHVNRSGALQPLAVTVVSMGIGAVVLLAAGIVVQGLPRLTLTHWLIILWLAVVNSAFAFTLWNRTLRVLSAMESSILNNTMLFQIALLAWIFLGERLTWREMLGMVLAALGTLVVQIKRNRAGCPGKGGEQMSGFIRTQGNKLVAGEPGDEVHLRGIAIRRSERPEPSPVDYRELVRLKVNTIRLAFSYRDFYDTETPDMYKEDAWRWLDDHVALARQHGIRLILQNFGVEGAQFVPIIGVPFDYSIWTDRDLQDRFIRLWHAIAERYHDEPQVAGYSLFFEPVVSESKEQWRSLAQRTINAIRKVDQNHTVFVERIYGENQVRREVSNVDLAPEDAFVAVADDNVVYEFYYFERDEYTHQFAPWRADVQKARVYPDEQWLIQYRERSGLQRNLPFNRDYLKFYLERQLAFGQAQNAPMAVWGFGALKTCFAKGRGGLQWLSDVVALLNKTGVHWTLWGFYGENFGIHENEVAKAVLRDALTKSN